MKRTSRFLLIPLAAIAMVLGLALPAQAYTIAGPYDRKCLLVGDTAANIYMTTAYQPGVSPPSAPYFRPYQLGIWSTNPVSQTSGWVIEYQISWYKDGALISQTGWNLDNNPNVLTTVSSGTGQYLTSWYVAYRGFDGSGYHYCTTVYYR